MSNTIETAVHAATANLIASGLIEKKIEETLAKTIESAIAEHLREYSDFGKKIKEKVSEALAVDFDRLTLPTYGASIVALIEQIVKQRADESIATSIKDRLDDMLANPPRLIKLSELVANYVKSVKDEYDRRDADSATCIVHRDPDRLSETFCMVHLAPNRVPTHDRYACPVAIHLMRVEKTDEWKVIGIRISGKDASKDPMFALGCDAYERSLYAMYAVGSHVIVDEDAVDTTYPEDHECRC